MKKVFTSFFVLFVFCVLSYGEDLSYFEKENNSWLQVYSNLLKAQALEDEIKMLERSIRNTSGKKKVELQQLLTLQTSKKKILDELPQSFDNMLSKITLGDAPKEINIIEYVFTNQKSKFRIQAQKLTILQHEYGEAVDFLKRELESTLKLDPRDTIKEYQLTKALDFFENARGLLENKKDVLKRTKEVYINDLEAYKQTQLPIHLVKIVILVFIFALFHLAKHVVIKRTKDEELLFRKKKVLNVTSFLTILLVLIILNINNLVYAATLIGVIAAAMTISMKEYLQSIATWFHLSFGNFIKVGDRILIQVNNNQIIGEVIHISLLKVTLYESINNTTSTQLKHAGRTIFIPNNFFVTNYVYNYTHDKMKTVYDLVEFHIAFGVDTKKVESLAIEIAYELTEKYIEVTTKQFQSLRNLYDMRSREFRPRIHFVPDPKYPCFTLQIWYVAPYHLVMELKSQLTQRVVKKFQSEGIEFCTQFK